MHDIVILTWAGAKDLQDITQSADHVILFGITCGLSAPYIAGQIDYSMRQVCYLRLQQWNQVILLHAMFLDSQTIPLSWWDLIL